ncbi:MAG: multi-sensor signal transduction histidine kinase [Actinomycetia bacterium]|nr:multi-sensor signal transduction histidine kinase [Actinomycetes bacterium]
MGVSGAAAAVAGTAARRRSTRWRSAVRAGEELRTTAARLDTLLARSPVAFAFFEPDGTITRVNDTFAALFGYRADQLTGRRVADALPSIWVRVEPLFEQVQTTGQPIVDLEVSGRIRSEPGVEQHWLASLFPVQRDAGKPGEAPIGLGALVVDITERKRAEQEIELLARASNLFAVDLTFDEAIEQVARLALPTFADVCIVFMPTANGSVRRATITHCDPDMERDLRAMSAQLPPPTPFGPAATAIRTGEVQFFEIVDEEARRAAAQNEEYLEYLEVLAGKSSITVPLGVGGRVAGAVAFLYTSTSKRQYRDADIEIARELGRRIAQVLESVRLAGDAARAAARLQLLARVGELLKIELDLAQRLRRVARLLLPEFADGTGVYLVENGVLNLVAAGHSDPQVQAALERAAFPSHGLDADVPPCEAVRTGRAVLVEELPGPAADEMVAGINVRATGNGNPLRSYLAVPMFGENGPIGALGFGYSASGRRYQPEDIPVALEIARRVAPAVENAQRYADNREMIEVLQRTLLPAALPEVPGIAITGRYIPGAAGLRIGGDWYDALVLTDGRLFLAIGDVVGHGVRAASSMGRLRNALEIYAVDNASPADILTNLNRHFCSFADADMATIGLLVYEPRTRRARLASAGHLPPLLREPDGHVHYLDPARGMPVCASPRAIYEETEVLITAGATLLLYTDGLVERRHEPLDDGFERLAVALRDGPDTVEALADHVIEKLSASSPPTDDVALLVVRFEAELTEFSMRLDAFPRELARLRRGIGEWAARAGASVDECDAIVLAVNEAAANAVEHAYGPGDARIEVTATASGVRSGAGVVDVRVRDFGRWRPDRPGVGGGRGLILIRDLMDDVSIETTNDGTTVRMTRALASGGPPA